MNKPNESISDLQKKTLKKYTPGFTSQKTDIL